MNTYIFEVTYKKGGEQGYCQVRAWDKEQAAQKAAESLGDISIIKVSLFDN